MLKLGKRQLRDITDQELRVIVEMSGCYGHKDYWGNFTITDIDQCDLSSVAHQSSAITAVYHAQTYEERLRDYEKRRQELLQLSKEALVDLILHRPTLY